MSFLDRNGCRILSLFLPSASYTYSQLITLTVPLSFSPLVTSLASFFFLTFAAFFLTTFSRWQFVERRVYFHSPSMDVQECPFSFTYFIFFLGVWEIDNGGAVSDRIMVIAIIVIKNKKPRKKGYIYTHYTALYCIWRRATFFRFFIFTFFF